jgi:DHA1 family tetracycline resistance protein-like MFS transporter
MGESAPIKTNGARTTTKRALGLIFFIMLMDIIGLAILYPVASYIVLRYSSEALMVTMISAIYAAAQFFSAPMLGKLGDRYGRQPVLLASVLGSAIGYAIFGIGGALWVLLLSRLIGGITGGSLSPASAYIADVSKPEERAKNFTLIGMAWGLGLILGPAMGAAFGQISLEAPAFTAAALSLLNLLLGFVFLPESLPRERRETAPIHANDLNPLVSIGKMARKPGLGLQLLVLCLFNFAFNGINSTEALFLIQKFAAQPWQVGLQIVLIGITIAAVQAALVRRLVPSYGEKVIALVCLLGQALSVLAMFFAPVFWLIYPITVLKSAVSGFISTTLSALISNSVSLNEQGALMGVNTALSSAMSILGPLWGGAVYDHVMLGAPYWMGAVVFVLAALMLTRVSVDKFSNHSHDP